MKEMPVTLLNEDISALQDNAEEKEIFDEKQIEILKKQKELIMQDNILYARLLLKAYNCLSGMNVESNVSKKLNKFLSQFEINELRILMTKYHDGNVLGDHFIKLRIENLVNDNFNLYSQLINTFFKVFEEKSDGA